MSGRSTPPPRCPPRVPAPGGPPRLLPSGGHHPAMSGIPRAAAAYQQHQQPAAAPAQQQQQQQQQRDEDPYGPAQPPPPQPGAFRSPPVRPLPPSLAMRAHQPAAAAEQPRQTSDSPQAPQCAPGAPASMGAAAAVAAPPARPPPGAQQALNCPQAPTPPVRTVTNASLSSPQSRAFQSPGAAGSPKHAASLSPPPPAFASPRSSLADPARKSSPMAGASAAAAPPAAAGEGSPCCSVSVSPPAAVQSPPMRTVIASPAGSPFPARFPLSPAPPPPAPPPTPSGGVAAPSALLELERALEDLMSPSSLSPAPTPPPKSPSPAPAAAAQTMSPTSGPPPIPRGPPQVSLARVGSALRPPGIQPAQRPPAPAQLPPRGSMPQQPPRAAPSHPPSARSPQCAPELEVLSPPAEPLESPPKTAALGPPHVPQFAMRQQGLVGHRVSHSGFQRPVSVQVPRCATGQQLLGSPAVVHPRRPSLPASQQPVLSAAPPPKPFARTPAQLQQAQSAQAEQGMPLWLTALLEAPQEVPEQQQQQQQPLRRGPEREGWNALPVTTPDETSACGDEAQLVADTEATIKELAVSELSKGIRVLRLPEYEEFVVSVSSNRTDLLLTPPNYDPQSESGPQSQQRVALSTVDKVDERVTPDGKAVAVVSFKNSATPHLTLQAKDRNSHSNFVDGAGALLGMPLHSKERTADLEFLTEVHRITIMLGPSPPPV
eukprot:m51a1_g5196 hypothetical protein (716) ;mRNA; r:206231-208495